MFDLLFEGGGSIMRREGETFATRTPGHAAKDFFCSFPSSCCSPDSMPLACFSTLLSPLDVLQLV